MKKNFLKTAALFVIAAMMSAMVSVPALAGDKDVTFLFGSDNSFKYGEENPNSLTYCTKIWSTATTFGSQKTTEWTLGCNYDSCITYGKYEGQGTAITIPQGIYEVYANGMNCSSKNTVYTLEIDGNKLVSEPTAPNTWRQYTDKYIGKYTSTGNTFDNFSLHVKDEDNNGNTASYVTSLKFKYVGANPDTYIRTNSTSEYSVKVWGGVSKVGADNLTLREASKGNAVSVGKVNGVGSRVVVPQGDYKVYVCAASVNPHYFSIGDIGTTITSETLPASGSYSTYKEEFAGNFSGSISVDSLALRVYIPTDTNDAAIIKYIKFEEVKETFDGTAVELDGEAVIEGANVTGGNMVEYDETAAILARGSSAQYTVNAAKAGRYELYADINAENAFSDTIIVNGNYQPSIALNENKNGSNFLGFVDLKAGENTVALLEGQNKIKVNTVTLKYSCPTPAHNQIIHKAGSDVSTTFAQANATIDTAKGTALMKGGKASTRVFYDINPDVSDAEVTGIYDVYANIAVPNAQRRATISVHAFYANNGVTPKTGWSEAEFGATAPAQVIPQATGGDNAFRNTYLGKFRITKDHVAIRISDWAQDSHAYVYGGGEVIIKDLYLVRNEEPCVEKLVKAISYTADNGTNEFVNQVELDVNESYDFEINTEECGLYSLDMLYGTANEVFEDQFINSPAVNVYVNGSLYKKVEMDSLNIKSNANGRVKLGDVYLNSGANTVKIENVTTHPETEQQPQYTTGTFNQSDAIWVRQITAAKAEAQIYCGEISDDWCIGYVLGGVGEDQLVKLDLNNALIGESATLIYALYRDGEPTWVDINDYNFTGNRSIIETIPAAETEEDGEYLLKVFIWDGMQSIKPLDSAIIKSAE